jgi:hypothetical protein
MRKNILGGNLIQDANKECMELLEPLSEVTVAKNAHHEKKFQCGADRSHFDADG